MWNAELAHDDRRKEDDDHHDEEDQRRVGYREILCNVQHRHSVFRESSRASATSLFLNMGAKIIINLEKAKSFASLSIICAKIFVNLHPESKLKIER